MVRLYVSLLLALTASLAWAADTSSASMNGEEVVNVTYNTETSTSPVIIPETNKTTLGNNSTSGPTTVMQSSTMAPQPSTMEPQPTTMDANATTMETKPTTIEPHPTTEVANTTTHKPSSAVIATSFSALSLCLISFFVAT